MKPLLSCVLTLSLLCSVFLVSEVSANKYTSGADLTNPISGRIAQDTMWNLSSSPYQVTGPIIINQGTTLTIEPGVAVELWTETLQVEGTLIARGTSTNQIKFTGGGVLFTETSTPWNEETGTGCILKNCILDAVTSKSEVKISDCTISFLKIGGKSTVSNSIINGQTEISEAAVLWKNTITGNVKTGIDGTPDRYPIIVGNTIMGPDIHREYGETGVSCRGYALVADNTITGHYFGVEVSVGVDKDRNNVLPNIRLERNKISGNIEGVFISQFPIQASSGSTQIAIVNNEVSANRRGIFLSQNVYGVVVSNNNLQANSNYTIYIQSKYNLNAQQNWWGTTDLWSINQTIYDIKNQGHLGAVSFTPCLTEANPLATPDQNWQVPAELTEIWATPSPTEPSPTQTPLQQIPATSQGLPDTPQSTGQTQTQQPTSISVDQASINRISGYWIVFTVIIVLVAAFVVVVVREGVKRI